jgi:oligopeptidase B
LWLLISDLLSDHFHAEVACDRNTTPCIPTCASFILEHVSPSIPAQSPIVPPVARRQPTSITLHGHTLHDDYAWLREKSSPEVIAYLNAENTYTESVMAPTAELQKKLYAEMLSHIQETDSSVPYRIDDWFFYTRTVEGLQYSLDCRKAADKNGKINDKAPEQIVLDVNKLAEGQAFMSIGEMAISPDGNWLAYSTDNTGFRQFTLHIRNLQTNTDLPETVAQTGSLVWAADSRTLFYTVEDNATKRFYRFYRHIAGTATASDVLVYEEPDERFNLAAHRTRDKKYILLEISSHITSEFRFLPTENPTEKFTLIAPRVNGQEYYPDHRNGFFFIRVNDIGPNYRLVITPVSSSDRNHWRELLPDRDHAPLEDFDVFSSFITILERVKGLPRLSIYPLAESSFSGPPREIAFPEPAYTASPGPNAVFDATLYRYHYQSLVSPASVFDYDVATGESTLLKQQPVPGGFDRTLYASERIWATASDGVEIPISLVYRKDRFAHDGSSPLYVYGYGSYGYPLPVGFSPSRLSLLDCGMVLAYAHIRGGGDLGEAWHDAGKMQLKRTTFTDFISCVEYLIHSRYGAADRVAIEGGSAGGLLMGAVVNLRPDLFRGVVSHVPFVDLMNTMLDASLPLTIPEYEEWGNPNEPDSFNIMLSYSPYDNLQPGAYPAMLVKTSLHDSQVMYWEPAKYVAKLRTLKTNSTPLLLHTNMSAGHGGSSGRYDYLKEIAFDYAFLLTQLGVE